MANKPCVCVHVTSGLDQLELALLSEDNMQIQHVASINCNLFDASTRRLQQPENLPDVIKQLFVAAKIPMGSLPTVLILPSYFSKNMSLTSNLNTDDIDMVLLSEVESHYVFKNQEPVVDWVKLDAQQVLYSAYMREDIDYWVNAFQELRIPLIVIDTGFFALIRGLMATGALQSVVEHTRPWMLVVMTENNCQIALLQGYQLKQAEDIPLGTEDIEMAVQDITQDIYRLLENKMVDQITLVNNTMRINMDVIKETLQLDVPTIDIVQTKFTVQSLGSSEQSTLYPCTLEALGGVLTQQFDYLPQLNFAPKQGRFMLEADNARQTSMRWLIVANVIAVILCAGLWGGLQGLIFFKSQQLQAVAPVNPKNMPGRPPGPPGNAPTPNTAPNTTAPVNENVVYRKLLTKALYERNTWVNNLMVAIGRELPEDAWINSMELKNVPVEAKTTVQVSGLTQSTDPMDAFQKTLSMLFDKKAPSLVSIEPDATSSSTYQWKLGLNTSATDKPADPAAPVPNGANAG
jgi:Tfp pilus assembly PilM family ATPase